MQTILPLAMVKFFGGKKSVLEDETGIVLKNFLSQVTSDEFTVLMNTFGVRLAPLIDLAIKYKKEYEDSKPKTEKVKEQQAN